MKHNRAAGATPQRGQLRLQRADPAPRCPSQGSREPCPRRGPAPGAGGAARPTGRPLTSPAPPAPPWCPRHTRASPAGTAAGAWSPAAGSGSGTAPSWRRSRTSAGKGGGNVRCLLCEGAETHLDGAGPYTDTSPQLPAAAVPAGRRREGSRKGMRVCLSSTSPSGVDADRIFRCRIFRSQQGRQAATPLCLTHSPGGSSDGHARAHGLRLLAETAPAAGRALGRAEQPPLPPAVRVPLRRQQGSQEHAGQGLCSRVRRCSGICPERSVQGGTRQLGRTNEFPACTQHPAQQEPRGGRRDELRSTRCCTTATLPQEVVPDLDTAAAWHRVQSVS